MCTLGRYSKILHVQHVQHVLPITPLQEETNTSELEADNTINKENSLKLHNSQSTCTEEEDNIKKRPRPILSSTSSLSTASNSDNWPACRSKLKSNKRKRVKPD